MLIQKFPLEIAQPSNAGRIMWLSHKLLQLTDFLITNDLKLIYAVFSFKGMVFHNNILLVLGKAIIILLRAPRKKTCFAVFLLLY